MEVPEFVPETQPATMDVSVIICTRNPRGDFLDDVLAALERQTLSRDRWELLIIDNGSSTPLAGTLDLSWHKSARVIYEPSLGKTFALFKALKEFRGNLFLIVDDDNVLRQDYLETAVEMGRSHSWLGAWSGSCLPRFETPPPIDIEPFLGVLVIDKVDRPYFANILHAREALPPGAGMVVRRRVVQRWAELWNADPLRKSLGHAGLAVGAGEDADMALCSLEFGLGVGRFPNLELTHLIPSRKITFAYLKSLHRAQAYSTVILNHIYSRSRSSDRTLIFPLFKHVVIFIANFLRATNTKHRAICVQNVRGKLRATFYLYRWLGKRSNFEKSST